MYPGQPRASQAELVQLAPAEAVVAVGAEAAAVAGVGSELLLEGASTGGAGWGGFVETRFTPGMGAKAVERAAWRWRNESVNSLREYI